MKQFLRHNYPDTLYALVYKLCRKTEYASVYVWLMGLEEMGYTAELSKHKMSLKLGISVVVSVYDKLMYCLERGLAAQKSIFLLLVLKVAVAHI